MTAGIDDHAPKPISSEALIRALRNLGCVNEKFDLRREQTVGLTIFGETETFDRNTFYFNSNS